MLPIILSDETLQQIKSLLPSDAYFVLIVANSKATSVDHNIPGGNLKPFLIETMQNVDAQQKPNKIKRRRQ